MDRIRRFTFRCSDLERSELLDLAGRLERTPSDVIRLLVRSALDQTAGDHQVEHSPQEPEVHHVISE